MIQGSEVFTHLDAPKVCSHTREVEFDSQHIIFFLFGLADIACQYTLFCFKNGHLDVIWRLHWLFILSHLGLQSQ